MALVFRQRHAFYEQGRHGDVTWLLNRARLRVPLEFQFGPNAEAFLPLPQFTYFRVVVLISPDVVYKSAQMAQ
ncbi:MAG: hypothetical protein ACLRXB_01290 [Escherichia coli]